MKDKLLVIFLAFIQLNVFAQFSCNDILYNEDTLVIINDELYSGICETPGKKGKIISRSYIGYGVLDSIVYYDKNGHVEAIEPYKKWVLDGTFKTYYKSGALKQLITYKNDKHLGMWREYYENGNVKYEAEYISDYETKDNSYYTWTKKGVKYLHTCVEKDKTKYIGKFEINSGYTKCKKIRVKT